MSYVDANGVHTYYEEHGSGDPLLLLHGGLADASGFALQTPAFAERYRVVVPDRRGHGRTPDVDGPITYDVMADDTIALTPDQKRSVINYIQTIHAQADPGGAGIGRIGPVGEGLVIWVVGVGVMLFGIFWMGSKA